MIIPQIYRYVILIPHRDALNPFEEFRTSLFSLGYEGAFSFPPAAPLAEVSHAFTSDELKKLAQTIRTLTMENKGKITTTGDACLCTPDKLPFFGPPLDLSIEEKHIPETARKKIQHIPSPAILCAALHPAPITHDLQPTTHIAFRAAALANLSIRSLSSGEAGYSFEWRIGSRVWLPKHCKKDQH